jgi:hypothetical protein
MVERPVAVGEPVKRARSDVENRVVAIDGGCG